MGITEARCHGTRPLHPINVLHYLCITSWVPERDGLRFHPRSIDSVCVAMPDAAGVRDIRH